MSPSKREQEYARRRHEKWVQRQQQQAAAHARRRKIGFLVLGIVVVIAIVAAIWGIIAANSDDAPTVADPGTTTEPTATSPCPTPTDLVTEPSVTFSSAPDPSLAQGREWTGTIATSCGDLGVTLAGDKAPQATASFVKLAEAGFFDNTLCHRITTSGIYVLQCGDPTGTGSGGPGYSFGPIENPPAADASGSAIYPAGTLAMANSGPADSNGSQFFIVYQDSPLAPNYTVFGQITSGLDIVQKIAEGGTASGSETDGQPAWPIAIKGVTVQ